MAITLRLWLVDGSSPGCGKYQTRSPIWRRLDISFGMQSAPEAGVGVFSARAMRGSLASTNNGVGDNARLLVPAVPDVCPGRPRSGLSRAESSLTHDCDTRS